MSSGIVAATFDDRHANGRHAQLRQSSGHAADHADDFKIIGSADTSIPAWLRDHFDKIKVEVSRFEHLGILV